MANPFTTLTVLRGHRRTSPSDRFHGRTLPPTGFAADFLPYVLFKMYKPPNRSLISDVHEDRLYDVWTKNPCLISYADAINSGDPDIQTFATRLGASLEIIDLRNVPVGMGFSWGRYGPDTDVKRLGTKPTFAYRKHERKTTLKSLLFGD